MCRRLSETEPLDNFGGDALGVADGFVDREVAGQIRLVDAAEHPEESSQARVSTLGGVAVNLTHSVAVVISRPLVCRVADREVAWPALVARQLVAEEGRSRR